MYMQCVHAWCIRRPEEGSGSPRIGVTDSCELGLEPRSAGRTSSVLNL